MLLSHAESSPLKSITPSAQNQTKTISKCILTLRLTGSSSFRPPSPSWSAPTATSSLSCPLLNPALTRGRNPRQSPARPTRALPRLIRSHTTLVGLHPFHRHIRNSMTSPRHFQTASCTSAIASPRKPPRDIGDYFPSTYTRLINHLPAATVSFPSHVCIYDSTDESLSWDFWHDTN